MYKVYIEDIYQISDEDEFLEYYDGTPGEEGFYKEFETKEEAQKWIKKHFQPDESGDTDWIAFIVHNDKVLESYP